MLRCVMAQPLHRGPPYQDHLGAVQSGVPAHTIPPPGGAPSPGWGGEVDLGGDIYRGCGTPRKPGRFPRQIHNTYAIYIHLRSKCYIGCAVIYRHSSLTPGTPGPTLGFVS